MLIGSPVSYPWLQGESIRNPGHARPDGGGGYETGLYEPGHTGCAGVIVINSCTVTGESDRKLRQLLRRCRRDNPQAVLVLTGCMPQAFPETAAALEEADVFWATPPGGNFPPGMEEYLLRHQRVVAVGSIPPGLNPFRSGNFREGPGRL